MKVCNKCHIEKAYSEFSRRSVSNDGYQSQCKICKRIQQQQHYIDNIQNYKQLAIQFLQKHRLPYYIVYLLPKHNYVCITNNPYYRMKNHQSHHTRDISGWIELHRLNTKEEALAKEAEYHSQGYNGGVG